MLGIICDAHGAKHCIYYTKLPMSISVLSLLLMFILPLFVLYTFSVEAVWIGGSFVPSFKSICMECVMCPFDVVSIFQV